MNTRSTTSAPRPALGTPAGSTENPCASDRFYRGYVYLYIPDVAGGP